ncbi:MAG: outer membrane beta-barrel protein [Bacteroidia bacterium]|nr:outer membrane beta-barrel protein [Bacteroidia bacterium]
MQPGFAWLDKKTLEVEYERCELVAHQALELFVDVLDGDANSYAAFRQLKTYNEQLEKRKAVAAVRGRGEPASNVVPIRRAEKATDTGDFNDFAETGLGIQGDAKFFVKESIAVGLDIGYNSFPFEIDRIDINYQIIPIRVSGEYFFNSQALRPYINGGIGVYILSVDNDDLGDDFDDSETEIGVHLGGGLLYGLGGNVNLNVNGRFNLIDDFSYFDLKVGLLFDLK